MATGTVEFKVKITDAFIPLNPRSSKTVTDFIIFLVLMLHY